MAGDVTGTGILTTPDFTSSWYCTIATAVNAHICTCPWICRKIISQSAIASNIIIVLLMIANMTKINIDEHAYLYYF
jgi:hypothetical protein